jgi:rhamnosyltransferase
MDYNPQITSSNNKAIITALITCYNPNYLELNNLLSSIKAQVNFTLLINNGGLDKTQINPELLPLVTIIDSPSNLGTAGGYNLGSLKAWELNSTHILLLDQDSECHGNMLEELLNLEQYLKKQNLKIAAIGPYYICRSNSKPAPFIQHIDYKIERIYHDSEKVLSFENNKKYAPCSYIISSGSLIGKDSWEKIGKKNADLFLDFTDIEWGLRAEHLGYKCYGSFDAKMYHLIGDQQLNILGRKISLHSPLRHYYAFRNCVWLFKQGYIPLGTRANYLVKLIPKLIIYSIFSPEPFKQFKFMVLGMLDGLFNKMGKYSA